MTKQVTRELIITGSVDEVTKILHNLSERFDTVDAVVKAYGPEVVVFS